MEILWLAIVFYSLGLAGVLYWRPRTMFHNNGTWKEFGYQRDSRHTIFPFWLFAIAWAFVSYAAAAAISWTIDSGATTATTIAVGSSGAAASALHFTEDDVESGPSFGSIASPMDESEATPVSRFSAPPAAPAPSSTNRNRRRTTAPKEKLRPGYYVLDEKSPDTGLKRYIYYGTNRP